MWRLLLPLIFCLPLLSQGLEGRVTDGERPLAGVRVSVDVLRRVNPSPVPHTFTAADGSFRLAEAGPDTVLVMEKDGYERDLVPVAALGAPVRLRPLPGFRRDRVLVVRLSFPGEPGGDPDRVSRLLFGRAPGESSLAAYVAEASRGALLLEGPVGPALPCPVSLAAEKDLSRDTVIAWVLKKLEGTDLGPFDQVDNRTGRPGPDGKPDHLWIVVPGPTRTITDDARHWSVRSALFPLPGKPALRWPVLFLTDETPVGVLVHEAFHAMGEHAVDDYYLEGQPLTAGGWDPMDAGLLKGWDCQHPEAGPWLEDTAYSPALPMAFTLADCWYRGWFRERARILAVEGESWEGWLDPLARAPGGTPQALRVPDPRRKGRFWELSVRRAWGFDRGRVGQRWGVGHEGLIVARIDRRLLRTDGDSRGPVRVIDAHPGTPEPPKPRYPGGRWQLDDAAFALGAGEVAAGKDGPLAWEVLAEDALGRMRVRVRLVGGKGRTK